MTVTTKNSWLVLTLLAGGAIASACGGGRPSNGGGGGDASSSDSGGNAGGASGTGGLMLGVGGNAGAGPGVGGSAPGAGGMSGGDAGTGTDGGTTPVPVTCTVAAPQCNDGMDNDGDGKFDSLDPECVGPCDNDEGSFATGISGDNIDACKQDCFFDGNSGMGDDGCDWNLKCDSASPGGTSCPYDPSYKNCSTNQSPKCIRNCQKLTPNGCDCFGCCAVNTGGATIGVLLVGTCTKDKFGDATACPRCTQNDKCVNTCDKCEVCIGRDAPDPSCMTGGTPDGGTSTGDGGTTPINPGQCPTGIVSCGPGGQVAATACGTGLYCQTGCCVSYTID